MEYVKQKVTKKHVKHRIENWQKRIADLYSLISSWISEYPEFKIESKDSVSMKEEMMVNFQIPPTLIKIADIYKNNNLVLSIKPKGLWVMGANGRIDIISSKGSYILVDNAEQFEEPKWHLYSPSDKKLGTKFTKQEFLKIL